MIISREHGYVFVELPRTGSTAVRKELISQYDGEAILRKHSTYHDFLKVASEAEKEYFAFSSIRNPLDDAVSGYFKIKTDHHGRYTDPIRRKYRVGNIGSQHVRDSGRDRRGRKPRSRSLREQLDNRKFDYVQTRDATFADYFRAFYWLPYDNWSRLSHADLDFVIRFEHLQEDFAAALDRIGLRATRPLPVVNKTDGKSGDYLSHYTPDIIPRAKRVYGPYLRRWGYGLPPGWERGPAERWNDALFDLLAIPRSFYWRWLRREF